MDALETARKIADALEDKKGEDILLLDLKNTAFITDYFVICTGTSKRMLKALADAALDEVHKIKELGARVEGEPVDGWILVDLGDVVLHIFSADQRKFYALEDLWQEGKVLLHLQ